MSAPTQALAPWRRRLTGWVAPRAVQGVALPALFALAAWLLIANAGTWLTLTAAGLALGMIVFTVSSGLTLVFGLMDVKNFGHGAFVAVGAYVAASTLAALAAWGGSESAWRNGAALAAAVLAAMAATAAMGWLFERLIVRRVYGRNLEQILITMGGMVVAEELIKAIWGAEQLPLPAPAALRGVVLFGDSSIERYRLLVLAVGVAVFVVLQWALNRTKLGLLIRAGVDDREMVDSLGYRSQRLFVLVFVGASSVAGLGGVLWGLFQQTIVPQLGTQVTVLTFIVTIIGGLGSVPGSFVGALLVGLLTNYCGYLEPRLAVVSNIALLVLVILWRPRGLFPLESR